MDLKTFSVIITVIGLSSLTASDQCIKTGPCSCKTSKGTIDLSGLIKGQPNPRFNISVSSYQYTFEPCEALSKPCNGQAGAAVCQQDINTASTYFMLGLASNVHFTGDTDNNTLMMTYMGGEGNRRANIILTCDKTSETLTFAGEKPSLNYTFILKSSFACIGSYVPVTPAHESHGLSVGSVLVILFFVFLAVYFVAGFLFLKYGRGAQGVEAIPNFGFWTELPSLVKDGVQFTCRGCKADSSYSQI